MRSDGSGQKVVSSPGFVLPSISPNDATIAYVSGGNIYTVPSAGGTAKEIYTLGNAVNSPLVWSPNGTQIAFAAVNSTTSKVNTYTMTSTGTSVTNITPGGFQGDAINPNAWSPDGTTIACTFQAPGASTTSIEYLGVTGNSDNNLTSSGFSDSWPCFSPDNQKLAFYRSNAGGATPGIYMCDYQGTNLQLILPDPSTGGTGPVVSLVWSNFLQRQVFAGSGGTMTTSPVNGFLASQFGNQFGSLLTFDTTTASTATITQSGTSPNGAPLAFTLAGDSINNISYTNAYNGAHVSIALTVTPTAVVTVDATTGMVDYVIPALAGKAHPTLTRSTGNALTYSGQFSAIYDGTGKNLAPNGASSVQLDRTTGKLISFQ